MIGLRCILLIFFLLVFIARPTDGQTMDDYMALAKGLPLTFTYSVEESFINSHQSELAAEWLHLTFKSDEPGYVETDGTKWYQRFYFKEYTYDSVSDAKADFRNRVEIHTAGKIVAVKCPYYSIRAGKRIYSLQTACNFNWKISRLVSNLHHEIIKEQNDLSKAIWCRSGGFCEVREN